MKSSNVMMPLGWEEHMLGNIASIKGGKRMPKGTSLLKGATDHPYIRVTDMGQRKINKSDLLYVPNDSFSKISRYIVSEGDVIVSIVGTIGSVALIDKELNNANLTENCVKLSDLKKIDSFFLYYFLTSSIGQNEIVKGIVGSTQPKLPLYNINNLSLKLPPLPEQRAIASILSALDDKIELNLQMNKTLEEMAMTLYKHWFVDFGPFQDGEFVDSELGMIPKGWEVKKIGQLYNTTSGGTPSRKILEYYEGGTIPWVKSKELYGCFIINTEEHITQLGLEKSSAKMIPAKSVLLAMYGATVGETSILSIEASCNQAICAIILKNTPCVYVFSFLRFYKHEILNQAVGSAQQNISQDIIKKINIVSPPFDLAVFDVLELYYSQIEQNLLENQSLTSLRDTLLPKLISGEVRVKDAAKIAEEVL